MIVTQEFLEKKCKQWRQDRCKIVLTCGCFDVLHRGHLELLRFAKNQGNMLIVGLNSDESVRQLKGANRPVNRWEDRAHLLISLKMVDYVVPFGEETPVSLIERILPDIYCKGGDYQGTYLIEAGAVHAGLGVIRLAPFIPDLSTTQILEKHMTKPKESSVSLAMKTGDVIKKEWGTETIIINKPSHAAKILEVSPRRMSSYHCHPEKNETWYVMDGEGYAEVDHELREMLTGSVIDIPAGTYHRFINPFFNKTLVFFEASGHHSDADVERLTESGPIGHWPTLEDMENHV